MDRLGNRPSALLRPSSIQETICTGSDIFHMLPEAYTWREMVSKWRLLKYVAMASCPTLDRPQILMCLCPVSSVLVVPFFPTSCRSSSLVNAPSLLIAQPDRFKYLLPGGCVREDSPWRLE